MLIDLRDKVAIITGAALGIGRGTALRLADEGVHLVLSDVLEDELEQTWNEARAGHPGNRGFTMKVDVASGEQVDGLVSETVKRLGKLDIMVNNAGVGQTVGAFADTADAVFERIVQVNQRGVFNGIRAACRVMREQRSGTIINIASWIGKSGHPFTGVYCSTKSAVICMTQVAALEMAQYGVRVNAISPGHVLTAQHWKFDRDEAQKRGGNVTAEDIQEEKRLSIPQLRMGTPDDMANAVIFLASELASYVTGHNLDVNGGVDVHSW